MDDQTITAPVPDWHDEERGLLTEKSETQISKYCQHLYEKDGGYSGIIEYGNKIGLQYGHCIPCENDMPMLITPKLRSCAVCGS